jgi:hypothetical protein
VCQHQIMGRAWIGRGARGALGLAVFAVLATAILLHPPKRLSDFDQLFYIAIAYDLVHHGVFSNGALDNVDSTRSVPPPGRFFGPAYPAVVAAIVKLDPRFARAVDCSVESDAGRRAASECEAYVRPVHIVHAALLAVGVLAIALAAELILGLSLAFWLTAVLATAALLPDADLFGFVMTESLTFCLYSLVALALIRSIKRPGLGGFVVTGALAGLLVLTRTGYATLVFVVPVLIVISLRRGERLAGRAAGYVAAFALACAAVVSPWMVRNAVSVGHWVLTEEYGSAALIERFAFNDMTAREFFLSFPYCLPAIGPPLVHAAFGEDAMDRFVYYTPKSFFHAGRLTRDKLVEAHGRLDPLIGGIVLNEMHDNWWRHLLVSVPLGWCGMWVGGALGLALVPLFAAAAVLARGASHRLLLIYAAPAVMMLGMHALIANGETRYNLILIGPLAIAGAWGALRLMGRGEDKAGAR